MRRWHISPDMPQAYPYTIMTMLILPQRKHIRLRDFDYSSANAYFITVCVKHFERLLGTIRSGICRLSEIGAEAAAYLQTIPEIYPDVILDEFIIMPNHLHAIIIIDRHSSSYQSNAFGKPVAGSVSMHVNHFKGRVKKWCKNNSWSEFDWQPKFHDHVIRNEQEYWLIKNYIIHNTRNWQDDRFYT